MIALLTGNVVHIASNHCIIDVQGVGYKVFMPSRVLQELELKAQRTVHIKTVVREDAITLYGFSTALQRDTFEVVCTVNKIGPKLGLAILSTLSLEELANAINTNNAPSLSRVPGVGAKTASRICLDLAGKLPSNIPLIASRKAGSILPNNRPEPDPLKLALAQLDYRKSEIDLVLNSEDVPAHGTAKIEERLRAALRFLAFKN
jgi:holliday junction DNA helicase RuvA